MGRKKCFVCFVGIVIYFHFPLFCMKACRENHVEVVKLLLDYGCNPSTPFPNSRYCVFVFVCVCMCSGVCNKVHIMYLLYSCNCSVQKMMSWSHTCVV